MENNNNRIVKEDCPGNLLLLYLLLWCFVLERYKRPRQVTRQTTIINCHAMDPSLYLQYVELVEAGEIRKAADQFFAPSFTIFKNNHEYTDLESFMRTKDFQHLFMRETINVLGYYQGENSFVVETMYGWHAERDVDRAEFEKAGLLDGYLPLKASESHETHCVFFYETEGTRFKRCRVYELGAQE